MSLPAPIVRRVHDELSDIGLSDADVWQRDVFLARLREQWPALEAGLRAVHPNRVEEVAERLVAIAARRFVERPAALHDLDRRRLDDPGWLTSPRMVGYAAYTDGLAPSLAALGERLDHLEELGVTYLHLMPLLAPRPGDSDGGYAVMDYRAVNPELGTMDDLRDLATTLRGRGISLVLDFVLNHVAAEHEWARRARAGEQKYRDYFLMFDDRTMPDAYEATLPEVFPDFAPGNFTWDDEAQAWVWTTFNAFQWDLDWTNPDVLAEYTDIMLFLANQGVEVVRLDAIAFLGKRLGTNGQNQPEVHDLTSVLRALARMAAPALAFKAEAIVGPHDLVQYLGLGEHEGRLSDLAYHNTWMVQLWSMMAAQDTRLAVQTLRGLPPTPPGAGWISYVRCHDDIGWAIDDADAAAVGLSGPAHRRFLSDFYAGDADGSFADGLVFQSNPETGDRRISGTTASLTGAAAADADTTDPSLASAGMARFKLLTAAMYGVGGLPVIWSGDEFALPNDADWQQRPHHGDDNRWAHRPRLPADVVAQRHVPGTTAAEAFAWHTHLARVRAGLPHLDGAIPSEVLPVATPGVLAVGRRHASGDLVELYNVTDSEQTWPASWLGGFTLGDAERLVDALTGDDVHRERLDGDGASNSEDGPKGEPVIVLPAWTSRWLLAADDDRAEASQGPSRSSSHSSDRSSHRPSVS